MRLNGASLAVATCLVLLVTGPAIADDEQGDSHARLNGTYRIFSQTSGVGSTAHGYFIGVITYDGHGQARMTDRGTIIDSNNHSNPPSAPSFEETGIFTYAVKRDGSFTQEGSFTSNPEESFTYTITGVKWVGQISPDGSVLILSGAIPPEPSIFTHEGVSSEGLGGFSATAVRILPE